MPSWNDHSSSGESFLGDITDLDLAPQTFEDSTFEGIAVGSGILCRSHKKEVRRCVAFGGTDIGRKFYLCPIEHQVFNCGFQSWVDDEWSDTLKNALSKLWAMYNESNSAFIDERYNSSKMMKELCDEKEKIEKKHAALLEDANKWFDDTEKKIQAENLDRMNREKLEDEQKEKYVEALKHEAKVLKNAKEQMKNVVKTQAEVFKVKQDKLVAARDALLDEKKNWEVDKTAILEEKKNWEADRAALLEEKKLEADSNLLLEENKKLHSERDAMLDEKKNWEAEKAAMKAENKKLERCMFDLWKTGNVHKEKFKRIRAICDE